MGREILYKIFKPLQSLLPSYRIPKMNSSRKRIEADKYSHIASNGLRVTKRTSQGVTLAWPEDEKDIVTFTDSNVSCLDMQTELDAQGNWFIVQMRKMEVDTSDWLTVYKGYGQRCDVDGLDADSLVLFRMKRNGDKNWGTEIIASTDPPQASAEELNRAVEMNSEYLVTRILGNSPTSHLKKILLAHDKNGMTPLMVAAHNGNHVIAKMLLSCGARVNDASTGVRRTPLMFACIIGKLNIVQLLDQNGADWRPKDKSGCNAMHHAINGGNLAIVRFAFAKLGQKLAFSPDHCGWSPLMRAVILSDNLDIIKFLVGKGADLNEIDRTNSKSILMAAILSRKSNFIKFLLEWGADPFYKNVNGKNCFDLARALEYKEIAILIRQRMEFLNPSLTLNNNTFDKSIIQDGKRSLSLKESNISVNTEVSDTLDTENNDMSMETKIPKDQKLPKDKDSVVGRISRRLTAASSSRDPPLHSITSTLDTMYLMRPHVKRI